MPLATSVEKTGVVFANPETASVWRPMPVRTIEFSASVGRHRSSLVEILARSWRLLPEAAMPSHDGDDTTEHSRVSPTLQPAKWLVRRLARVQFCKKQGKQFD